MGTILTDELKLKDLREQIIDVARNERNGLLMFEMGVFLFFAGIIVRVLENNVVAQIGGLFFIALGTLSTVLGFYVTVNYSRQYNNLLKALAHT